VFPNEVSVLRLVGAVLLEIDDEWQVERRHFSQSSLEQRRQAGEPQALPSGADKRLARVS